MYCTVCIPRWQVSEQLIIELVFAREMFDLASREEKFGANQTSPLVSDATPKPKSLFYITL